MAIQLESAALTAHKEPQETASNSPFSCKTIIYYDVNKTAKHLEKELSFRLGDFGEHFLGGNVILALVKILSNELKRTDRLDKG